MILTTRWLRSGWLVGLLCLAHAAHADVVIVAGANSLIGPLSKQQVVEIYLGRQKSLPGGEPVVTCLIASGPVKDEFLSTVLERSDSQARAIWARLVFTGLGGVPRELKDAAEVKKWVTDKPNGIGVIDKAALDKTVKVVFAP